LVDDDYHTVTIDIRRLGETYAIVLRHDDPGSIGEEERHGTAVFGREELVRLLELQLRPEEYGRALAEQLFCDPQVAEGFVAAEAAAQASDASLRIRLRIDPAARELHTLRWELLRHPRANVALSTSERVVLSRFMSAQGHGRIKPRARTELNALVVVSAPPPESLAAMKLAPVDHEGELHRAREALDGMRIRTLGGPASPATLDRLIDELRRGIDIVYLVCHGMVGRQGTPALILQDDAGTARRVEGQALATRIAELRERPRLMVLASCQSAGDGEQQLPVDPVTAESGKGADKAERSTVAHPTTAQATTASLLAEAGVPAIIAMQGLISMRTVGVMMPTLFSELLRDGRIDRALAVARGKVRDHHDWWMPVLYSRLKTGLLWSMPGLGSDPRGRNREIIDFSEERGRHEELFGREDVLAEMDAWLEARDSGWLVLTGAPGLGKSALMSRWARGREERGLPIAIHFIRSGHKDWADASRLRQSLAAQIEEDFSEQRDAQADPTNRLEQLLQRVSPVLVARDERLVLLVDGLDEAMEPGGKDPIPQMFPLEVPARVFVVVASRPKFPSLGWFDRRTGPSTRLDLDARAESNERAVREYWKALGPELGFRQELLRAAIEGAEGNLLHAVKLRERWSERGAMPSADDVPKGFQGMLDELWDRIGRLPDEDNARVEDGLSLLCAARESLPLTVVEGVLGWREGRAERKFLPHAREMLLEERWHEPPGYRLFHEGFRELVTSKLPRAVAGHHRGLARFAAWPLEGDAFQRRYALRHRVEHRVEVGDSMGAAKACMDVGYLTAKACAEGVVAVERDIRLTAEACEPGESRERLITLGQLVAASAHWANEVPQALPALLHDRALTNTPELLGDLVGLAGLLPEHPRLRHALRPRAMSRVLGALQFSVTALAVLPNGQVVSCAGDKTMRVWDLESGRTISSLDGHQNRVNALAVLPDGRIVSGSGDKTVRVWDVDSGRVVATLKGHEAPVMALAVLPDGRVVSGSGDKTVRVWDVESGRVVATLEGHQSWVRALVVLPDGRVISGSDDDTLRVWDVASGRTVATLECHQGWVLALAVLPNGHVVSSGDETVRVWDVDDGRVAATFEGHRDSVSTLAVLPNGRVVSGSNDNTVQVWEVGSGRAVATLEGHQGWIRALAVLPDGRVISASDDETVRLWDIDTDRTFATFQGHRGGVMALAMLPGRRVVSSGGETVRVWDVDKGRTVAVLDGHQGLVTELAVLPNGRIVSGSDDKTVRVWDVDSGQTTVTLEGHQGWVRALAVLPDGRIVSGSDDKTVRVWDVDSGRTIVTLEGHQGWVRALAVLPDGRIVSGSDDETVRVWDVDSSRTIAILEGHQYAMRALAVLHDGRLVSGSYEKTIRVWDMDSGRTVATLEGHRGCVRALAVLPDGRVVSASEDKTVRVWDADSSRTVATVYGDATFASVAAIDDHLIVAGDGLGNVWFIDLPDLG